MSVETATPEDLGEVERQRRLKLQALRDSGIEPFAESYDRTHSAFEAHELFRESAPASDAEHRTSEVRVAGRVIGHRMHGKAGFATIADLSGTIQIYARVDVLGEGRYRLFSDLDVGDIIGVAGPVFRTRRGEISVEAQDLTLLTKSLRQLPEKWHGLKDPELRHRQRPLDMIANPWVRDVLVARSVMVSRIRRLLDERGFLEIETPVLQPQYGGAAARPFTTHYNALDHDFYLRIATELYLKRLLVGGFERVYEVGRCFRNEGLSTQHNPEYTLLEVYQAYTNLEGMMELTEYLIRELAQILPEGLRRSYQGREVSLESPWLRRSMVDLVREHTGIDALSMSAGQLEAQTRQAGVDIARGAAWGISLNELFEKRVEQHLWEPVFVTDFPVEISPLARRRADDPRFARRFELWIAGRELANAFSELTDPIDQRERFEMQARARQEGYQDAHPMDEDFVLALEHGMPPAGGLGIGIDRLVMLLTDQPSIREVVAFPQLRPRTE